MGPKGKSKKKIKISIVIPTKNEEKNIKKTINQFTKYRRRYNLEIIISDGGSNDNTVKIAKKYTDIVVTHHKKTRQTISAGRNKGAKKATGDILIFVDAAVRVPDVPKLLDNALEMYDKKDIAAATMDMYIYPWEENILDRILYFIGNIIVRLSILMKKCIIKGECQIMRKELFDKIRGYDQNLVVAEDSDLYRRISKYGKIVCLKDVKIYDSPRRFRKQGYLKTIWQYTTNNVLALFGRKPISKEWKPIR